MSGAGLANLLRLIGFLGKEYERYSSKPKYQSNSGSYGQPRVVVETAEEKIERQKCEWLSEYYIEPFSSALRGNFAFLLMVSIGIAIGVNNIDILANLPSLVKVFFVLPLEILFSILFIVWIFSRLNKANNNIGQVKKLVDEYNRQVESKDFKYFTEIRSYVLSVRLRAFTVLFQPLALIITVCAAFVIRNNNLLPVLGNGDLIQNHPIFVFSCLIFISQYLAIGISSVMASLVTKQPIS